VSSSITLTTRDGDVAVLTFDQPGNRANILSPAVWSDLAAALADAASRSPRGLILASAKPGIFIAGADLNVIRAATAPNDPAVRALIEQGLRVLETLESFPAPTVAAIDGAALGGGLEVALACDFRVVGSHPKCSLGLPEVQLGLIPGWGGTQRLPRIIGPALAAEMLTTGTPVNASRAVEIGLADAAFDSEGLIEHAANLVLTRQNQTRRTAKRDPIPSAILSSFKAAIPSSPTAIRTALLVMEEGALLPLAEAIPVETAAFLRLAGSDESRVAIEAFFNRKK
jgi:enoyl-CoA hydratase